MFYLALSNLVTMAQSELPRSPCFHGRGSRPSVAEELGIACVPIRDKPATLWLLWKRKKEIPRLVSKLKPVSVCFFSTTGLWICARAVRLV